MSAFYFLSGLVVVLAGLFCVGLAVGILYYQAATYRFLSRFAASARAHFIEQGVRLCAGCALIAFAPHMVWSQAFRIFGWILAITAVALMLTPWRIHRRFAEWSIPWAVRNRGIYAGGAFFLGVLMLYAALLGITDGVN